LQAVVLGLILPVALVLLYQRIIIYTLSILVPLFKMHFIPKVVLGIDGIYFAGLNIFFKKYSLPPLF